MCKLTVEYGDFLRDLGNVVTRFSFDEKTVEREIKNNTSKRSSVVDII